jgi:hypothetical protein
MKSQKPPAESQTSVESQPKYKPNAQEIAALKSHLDRRGKQAAPRVKIGNGRPLSFDHPDGKYGQVLLMEALGTADYEFFIGLLLQLTDSSSRGGMVDERLVNFMLAVIKGIKPRDQIEVMLAAQMAAIHEAIMTFTKRLAHVETIPEQDSAERALNKLARTFATQMEALQRYRNGGEQKVLVQQVSVSDGSQAIVAGVMQPRREASHGAPDAQPLVAHEPHPEMAVIDRHGERAPISIEQIKAQKAHSKR